MTSISNQQQNLAQNPSTAAQSVAPVSTPSSFSGTSSQQAAAGRGFGSTNKRQGTYPNSASSAHGKSDSTPSISGKGPIHPAVPTTLGGGPTIVNGNNAVSPTSLQFEHSRKSSVTISATGTSGQMPNGGPVVGKTPQGNGIPPVQFGSINSMNAGASPSISNSMPQISPNPSSLAVSSTSDPRVTVPTKSPSPIPQPLASSGGRPPSSFHNQGNGLSFGSIGDDAARQVRGSMSGMPTGSHTPGVQSAQLRRESSQQSNSDMANGNMGMNGGRGGYPQQGGRGRNYNQQMPYSPNTQGFRGGPPSAPRGNSGLPPSPYPVTRSMNSYQGRSPQPGSVMPINMASPQPMHQQMHMPMQSPAMTGQHFAGYPPHMGPQVNPQFHSANSSFSTQQQRAPVGALSPLSHTSAPIALPKTLSPESGQFEEFLTKHKQGQYMPQYGFPETPTVPGAPYYAGPYGLQPMPMSPYPQQQSPRPSFSSQHGQPPYVTGQYGHPQPMSRTPSGVTQAERPPSTLSAGQPPTPMTPAVSLQPSQSSRAASSPGPKSTEFRVPKKSAGIVIKDPTSGLVKTFEKPPESPAATATTAPSKSPAIAAPPSRSPVTVSSASTPPSRTPSHADTHTRTESKSTQNNSELVRKFKEDIANKLVADKAEQRAKQDVEIKEEPDKAGVEEKATHEATVTENTRAAVDEKPTDDLEVPSAEEPKNQGETLAPAGEVEKPKNEEPPAPEADEEQKHVPELKVESKEESTKEPKEKAEEESKEESKEEPKEEPKAEPKAESKEPEVDEDSDEYWERIEAEERRKEEEMEKAYQAKKKAQTEEKARQEAEATARLEEELKRAEREAEAREDEKLKKLEANEGDDKVDKKDIFALLKKSDNAFKATESASADTPTSGMATPTSEASSMGPPATKVTGQTKQKPAALKLKTAEQVEAPQPSAALQSLRSARFLQKIDDSTYPAAIASPNPALNSTAPMGKFRYNKNFLLQFQTVFTEKPSETWSDRVKETVGDTSETPASARPRGSNNTMPPRSASRPSVMSNPFQAMGSFNNPRTIPPGTTSQERFMASNRELQKGPPGNLRYNPTVGGGGFPMPFGSNMQRTPSSTGSMGHPQSPRNNPSHRGSQRGSKAGKRDTDKEAKTMPLTAGQDLKAIEVSASGWKPRSIGANAVAGPPPGGDASYLAPDVVQRKVKSNLNKMTPTTFEKISSQILEIVMQSKMETDGRTLRQIIQLTFEKATDEAHWAEMYAQFCGKMLRNMSPDIKDETLGLDKNGNVNAGSTLFRKYLLNRCQTEFEAGWKSKLPDKPEGDSNEAAMLSDEYYKAATAKRRGLGLVKFIGELFKLGMLTSRIMHMCVHKLLEYEGVPDEPEVESLTSLLKTIGSNLDTDEKSHGSMDAYFQRINDTIKLEALPSRLRFMLMDIVDLRRKGWKTTSAAGKGPATIEEVHAQAAAAEREKEAQRIADASRRGGGGGGRMPMGRGDARHMGGNSMMPPPQQNSVGMDDLRRLGKGGSRQPSSQGPMSFGPPSMFGNRGSNTRKPLGVLSRGGEESGASSRTATPPTQSQKKDEKDSTKGTNAFSALASLNPDEANDNPASPPSANSSPSLATARPAQQRQRSKSPLKDEEAA